MIDIHTGICAEDAIILKTRRLNAALLNDEHFEAFYIGYYDRINEELDDRKYNKVDSVNTILEFFYHIGYRFSDNEIYLSGLVRKSLPGLEGFKKSIITYLDRMNIVEYYEREK